MDLDLSKFIIGFKEKLYTSKQEEGLLEQENIQNKDDISIFDNKKEFKAALTTEFDDELASEIFANMSDLDNLEIVDGQLVFDSEIKEETSENETTINETTDDKTAQNKESLDESEITPEQRFIVEILNELLQDDDFKEMIDVNENGEFDKEDLQTFLDIIKGLDENGENISIEDIAKAFDFIQQNKDGEFKLDSDAIQAATSPKRTEAPEAQVPASANPSGSVPVKAGGNPTRIQAPPKTIENMSLSELEKKRDEEAKPAVEKARGDIENIHNGKNSKVAAAQQEADLAESIYATTINELNQALGQELKAVLENISTKEKEISQTESSINKQESSIASKKSELASASSNVDALKSSLNSLGSSDDPKIQKEIESKREDINKKIKEAEKKEQAIKDELGDENSTDENTLYGQLNKTKENLDTQKEELAKLKEGPREDGARSKAEIEKDIATLEESHPEAKQAREAYNKAKENVETVKKEELDVANAALKTAQDGLDAINTQINKLESKQIQKDNAINALTLYNEEYGSKIAETAAKVHPNGGFGGYCAAGVSDSLVAATGKEKTYGDGWEYKNVMQGRDDFAEYTDFNFEELQNDNQAMREFLASLPPGAVVSFDKSARMPYGHVMIMDGKGNEISDGTNAIGNYYHKYSGMSVFIPIG